MEVKTSVRALHDLDEGRTATSIQLLREWLEKQEHLPKKDFSDHYLETILISSKGLVERAKAKIDKYCTIRTMMPKFFDKVDLKNEFEGNITLYRIMLCQNLTEAYTRIVVYKMTDGEVTSELIMSSYKYAVGICEYLRENDYFDGVEVIIDYSTVNIGNLLAKMNPIDLGQAFTLVTDGYSMRLKSIHIICPSKMVDALVGLFKQVMSKKLADRIHVHKTHETLQDYLPLDLLPSDYGGKDKSILELSNDLMNKVGSEKHIAHMVRMQGARSLEPLRPAGDFSAHCLGMPGSFRALSVD